MTCGEYLTARISEVAGRDVVINSRKPVGGGCINNAELLSLSSGDRIFLKRNRSSFEKLFAAEAAGLDALAASDGPRVPRVIGLHDDGEEQIILLEYIESGPKSASFSEKFGRQLAALHRNNDERGFGFSSDNHIGATRQPNSWKKSWLEFFASERIGFQIGLARDSGKADKDMIRGCEKFISTIDRILIEPEASSLLHGDLWGGNYMVDASGDPVLIDPAVYYGHREADLAMTQLFGGFGSAFYEAYNEEWPLEPGFRERRDAYNLYHMLNHLNLFGGSYAGSVHSILKRWLV